MRWDEAGVFSPQTAARLARSLGDVWSPVAIDERPELGCLLARDDLGPHATHKARGVGAQLALAAEEAPRGVALSSSGNAGIAAARWCAELGIPCFVFVSERTHTGKIDAIARAGAEVVVTAKPKNLSRHAARYGRLVDLRGSRSEDGALGYRLLAAELRPAAPSAVFVFCNSGLTLIGLAEGLERLRGAGGAGAWTPQLHAVVCSPAPDLSDALGVPHRHEESPVAGALGLQVSPRLDELAAALRDSGGTVWSVTNDEVGAAAARLRAEGVDAAAESAAAYAGLVRAREQGWATGERPLVLIAAPAWQPAPDSERSLLDRHVHRLDDYAEVMALLEARGLGRSGGAAR